MCELCFVNQGNTNKICSETGSSNLPSCLHKRQEWLCWRHGEKRPIICCWWKCTVVLTLKMIMYEFLTMPVLSQIPLLGLYLMEKEAGVKDRSRVHCSKQDVGLTWRSTERDELIKTHCKILFGHVKERNHAICMTQIILEEMLSQISQSKK